MKKVMNDIFLKLMLNILKLHELHNHLPFLPDRIKIAKVEKLVANLHDKSEYVTHIKKIKTSVQSWLKPYIDMTTDLIIKAKYDFEKGFFS